MPRSRLASARAARKARRVVSGGGRNVHFAVPIARACLEIRRCDSSEAAMARGLAPGPGRCGHGGEGPIEPRSGESPAPRGASSTPDTAGDLAPGHGGKGQWRRAPPSQRSERVRHDGRVGDPHQLWDHLAWPLWLRRHSIDPQTFSGPIRGDGDATWAWGRWERWQAGDPRWTTFVLDTTGEPAGASAERLADWITEQRRLRAEGRLPLSGRWWDGPGD